MSSMTINDLIRQLEEARDKYGNISLQVGFSLENWPKEDTELYSTEDIHTDIIFREPECVKGPTGELVVVSVKPYFVIQNNS